MRESMIEGLEDLGKINNIIARNELILSNEQVFFKGKNFIEMSLDIILVVDKYGKILYGNKKAVETYGYSFDELVRLDIFALRNEDKREFTQKQLNKALKSGIQFKTYHYRKDGSSFPVEVRSIYSNEESKNTVVSIIRDISDIEEIYKNSKIFSISLDILDDPFIVYTKEMNISYWSNGAEIKFGYKKEEVLGKSMRELIPKDLLDESKMITNQLSSGNIVKDFETIRLDKHGKMVDVLLSASPIYDMDGIFSGIVAIYKDVSEKKELIKKCRENEERWRFALEGGKFGVWDWNISNNEMFYSNSWKKIIGYDDGEINNSFEEFTNSIHQDDLEYVMDKIDKHFLGEEYAIEFRRKCKDNNYKWVKSRGKVVNWTSNGKPLRMVGTVEDISDRKLIELELIEKNKQLELSRQEADKANKVKSLFLANVSHEIRTPMNGILATIQLLQLEGLTEAQNKYTKMLKESADNLLAIINNLLDISKIESGTFKLDIRHFNLKETVNYIHDHLLITGNSKGLEIRHYLDPNIDFEVIGDEVRLKEILTNLISNAIKFTDEGYVSFRVKMLSTNKNSEKIEFSVIDSGIGIDDSFKEKIFTSFSQGDLSTRKKYMGTGLGLSISKQLASLMNGSISFESTVGKGSKFVFTCEFERFNNKKTENNINNIIDKIVTVNDSAQNKVILGVEDNLISQEVMESIVKKKGYKYIPAYDGNEALNILKDNDVDLILMDVQMPELNGFETTRIIRNVESYRKDIPIIGMTAYATLNDKNKCIQEGMNEYISKPFDIEELYKIIEFYLEK